VSRAPHFNRSLPQPIVLVYGGMAHGHLSDETTPYVEKWLSVSEYPLSGAVAISRTLNAFENKWGIL
jgi:rRNA small subunit pseudouridine methyltransferase Nep1